MDSTTERRPLLEVRHLKMYFTTKKRGRKRVVKAVDDVSFEIYPGEVYGLVGESGCGKTTTGRTIIRLYTPTGGEVYFKDKLISGKLKAADRRFITENIAMIFQDPIASLNPRMTVEEIIGDGLKRRGMKDATERHAKIVDMLQHVGLMAEHATRYPHEFSGGQRQRIGIARALIMNPKLLICDEPISALDVSIRAQIINLLNDLKRDLNLSIIFIAHDLSVVKYFCDSIVVMYFGKVVEKAPSDELFKHPMHPYTRSLLSAIPKPNPRSERTRKRITYDPTTAHDYSDGNMPTLRELTKDHFVYCNETEYQNYLKEMKE